MSISAIEIEIPLAQAVRVTEDSLHVDLADGRTISVPLAWYPRLLHATADERNRWRLIGMGRGIHWEALDEDISGIMEQPPPAPDPLLDENPLVFTEREHFSWQRATSLRP